METISSSQISAMFGQYACPASYYWDKVARVPRKPRAALEIGKAMEAAVTDYHETGTMNPSIFTQTMDAIRAGTYADRFDAPKFWYADLPDEEKAEFDEAVGEIDAPALLNEYANNVKPLKVIDKQIEIKIPILKLDNGEDLILYNYPDLLVEEHGLIELKTASRSWSDRDIAGKYQHVIEVMAVEQHLGWRPKIAYHVLVKTKVPKIQVFPLEVTDEEIEQVKNLLIQAYQAKKRFSYTPHFRDQSHCFACGSDHRKDFFFQS